MEEETVCGFEGVEKRLEIDFVSTAAPAGRSDMRRVPRAKLDAILSEAACTIVSEHHGENLDAYVLSESSLFVYPATVILKTCGTTQLLKAVAPLLEAAASEVVGMRPWRCKYSRGTFLFPRAQPFPYNAAFAEEARVLSAHFPGAASAAKTLAGESGRNWHIYTAIIHHPVLYVSPSTPPQPSTPFIYTLEICMTRLHPSVCSHFMNPDGDVTASQMTQFSGIRRLLPTTAVISDFAFSPCGYSMNAIDGAAIATAHVTPEEAHSYASFEVARYATHSTHVPQLVSSVVSTFRPGAFVACLHVAPASLDYEGHIDKNLTSMATPNGYKCNSSVMQKLPDCSLVGFHTFSIASASDSTSSIFPAAKFSLTKTITPHSLDFLINS